jgi:hypothetical protein
MLSGCGASQPPIGALGAMPQSSARATHADRSKSWMLPEAKDESLIYATGGCGGVCVAKYSNGDVVGSISLSYPFGADCSDNSGNVFVTNNAQVLEYAHGGTTPIASLDLPGENAAACGVDAKSGNLAVTFAGRVAIFANATGTPAVYNAGIGAMYCGYDDRGNLFVSGVLSEESAFAELAYKGSAFVTLAVSGNAGGPGQVQWDGKYITVENQNRPAVTISRLSVSGSTASVVSTTRIKGAEFAASTWIIENRIVVPYSSRGEYKNKIGLWRYPKSSKVVVKYGSLGQPKGTSFLGVTLSAH